MKIECSQCAALNELDAKRCWKCKAPISVAQYEAALASADEHRRAEASALAAAKAEEEKQREAAKAAFGAGDMDAIPKAFWAEFVPQTMVSTSPFIHGREVGATLTIVSAECAFGMNAFKDLFIGVSDVFGGRSNTVQNAFRDARRICIDELRKEAMLVGGNAVVSVTLSYNEMSGGGKSGLLFLVATGTAVRLKPDS